jgi:hypothetical protein
MSRARISLVLVGSLALTACDFLRGYAEGHSTSLQPYEEQDLTTAQLGAARFLYDDFGALSTDTLETNAVPWKLVAAALVLEKYPGEPATVAHLHSVLTSYGFIFPRSVVNWPLGEQPAFPRPLGITSGIVRRNLPTIAVEAANLGCASCHGGATYDASGMPQMDVWLGLPNSSLDLDAYAEGVVGALRAATKRRDATFEAVWRLFPDMSSIEQQTLEKSVWPEIVERMENGEPGLTLRSGGPGRSNGVEALKVQYHVAAGAQPAAAAVSIPEIGDLSLRWSVLVDGVYTRAGDPRFQPRGRDEAAAPARTAEIIAFFTAPTMGMHPDKASAAVQPVAEVLQFLSGYESPKFPGTIDEAAASRGAVVYARCAECHGEYVERNGRLTLRSFPNRLSPLEEIGTDRARLDAVNEPLIRAVAESPWSRFIDARQTRGYVAPSLAGLWATAPYLHNGSVPTLSALMSPASRPAKFLVGGHKLDFVKMGIAARPDAAGVWVYPADYLPWSTPRLFDTSLPGHSNRGHEKEFDGLTDADKADLIEFLKQL